MSKVTKYGIQFPSHIKDGDYLLDLNKTIVDNVKSQLIHLIFTPEGQRLREPLFGTNLIQFLFNPNDSQSWDDVVMYIKTKVNQYIYNCTLEDIEAITDEDDNINIKIVFSVVERDGVRRSYELTQII